MIFNDRSSMLAAWTAHRFRKQIFTKGFSLTTGVRSRTLHKHYIHYMRIADFFVTFTIFEIIFIFSFWNKTSERIGYAKARLL